MGAEESGGFYHLPALGRAGSCPGVGSPTANAAVAFHPSFLTTSSSPLPRHPVHPAWSWLNSGRGQRAQPRAQPAPGASCASGPGGPDFSWPTSSSTTPGAQEEVGQGTFTCASRGAGWVAWLGQTRRLLAERGPGPGLQARRGFAAGRLAEPPCVGSGCPGSCLMLWGHRHTGGGWGECPSRVCPAKWHSSPLGLAGSEDSNPGHQPRQTLPSLSQSPPPTWSSPA